MFISTSVNAAEKDITLTDSIKIPETVSVIAQEQDTMNTRNKDNTINFSCSIDECNLKFQTKGNYNIYIHNPCAKFADTNTVEFNKKTNPAKEYISQSDFLLIGSIKNSKTYKIENLQPGTRYKFYIYTVNNNTEVLTRTIDTATKPLSVKITKSEVSASSISISWYDSNKNVDHYKILRNEKEIAKTTKQQFNDHNLKANTNYSYKIIPVIKISKDNVIEGNATKISKKTNSLMSIGTISGKCKTWANYQAVTAKSSPQYKLLHSQDCYTDKTTGIRKVGNYYCVALGSYYGSKIGQKYIIKLSSGQEFNAILCDQKSDRHTDSTHRYAVRNKDIVEFYIDRAYKPAAVGGDYGVLKQFKGSIVSIEKIR